jgi:hypothetical protein
MKDDKHWFKGETLWNHRRKVSDWHFDPTVDGESSDKVRVNFIKFRGDWDSELDHTVYNKKQVLDLSQLLVRLGVQEHIELGVNPRILGSRADVDPVIHKKISKMVKTFKLEKPLAQIMLQKPGEMATLHIDAICHDNFDRNKVTDMEQVTSDQESIRVFVALKDWSWGQYLMMGNYHWMQWKAGDVMWFRWQDLPHASANCGHMHRPFLKITGKRTEAFEELLQKNDHLINV